MGFSVAIWLQLINILVISHALMQKICAKRHRSSRLYDDEVSRRGIKFEFTTHGDYLEERFVGLSKSGHDLTPLLHEEIMRLEEELCDRGDYDGLFLGAGQKGLYCERVGGLPLFSSGCRIDEKCSKSALAFDEACDDDHVLVTPGGLVMDVRCGRRIGERSASDGLFYVLPSEVVFYALSEALPPQSQPENFWGTEGQYTTRLEGPLSY